jgi:hypothetical protein
MKVGSTFKEIKEFYWPPYIEIIKRNLPGVTFGENMF